MGTVSSFATSGGSAQWHVSLKPEHENTSTPWYSMSLSLGGSSGNAGYGGGLAVDNGRLYAASGFGNVVALDPETGKKLWEKQLEAPVRSSPTAAGDKVFVITLDGRFYCLAGADGGELWSVRGLPQQASLINNASPAVDGGIVVVPYPSGDLVALKVADGGAVWTESLSRTRTTSQLTSMSDAARPAIDRGTVFAVGHAGRMIATQAATGERVWSLNVPGTQTPWVAGENVFVVRDHRPAHGVVAQGRQDPVDDEAAARRRLVRADARGRHAVARLRQGNARRRRCREWSRHHAKGAGQPHLRRAHRGAGADVHPDRQRQADRAQLAVDRQARSLRNPLSQV